VLYKIGLDVERPGLGLKSHLLAWPWPRLKKSLVLAMKMMASNPSFLSLSRSWSGGGSPPRSAPESPKGVEGPCWIFLLDRCPSGPGHELDTVASGVLPSRQCHCSVDRWQSPGTRSGEDILPATESDQCVAGSPSCTGPWSSHVASTNPSLVWGTTFLCHLSNVYLRMHSSTVY